MGVVRRLQKFRKDVIARLGPLGDRRLTAVPPRQLTDYAPRRWPGCVRRLRRKHYRVDTDLELLGDAPKEFIRVYEAGGNPKAPKTWPAFIAKVGHKRYPSESITEQLLTRLGETMGLRMADSKLMSAGGQLRFCSRYFLNGDDILVHGAQILAGYLADRPFVEQVQQDPKLEREIFTFQVVCTAITTLFPEEKDAILRHLVRMVGFDSLVGNQDRHLYNWGVIQHPRALHPPRFSPIFDTARGLFWNVGEDGLSRYEASGAVEKYVQNSTPLIGWDGQHNVNHFALIRNIAQHRAEFRRVLRHLGDGVKLDLINTMVIDGEFKELFSSRRRELVKQCLQVRWDLYREAVS